MPASLTRLPVRCLVVGLVALLAGLTFTAVAQGWRRPSSFAVSSPGGGLLDVCRDGIRFQIASHQTSPDENGNFPDRPTGPVTTFGFTAYSPPPVLDPNTFELVGGTIVARGMATLQLQTTPVDTGSVGNFTFFYWYLGTHTQRWSGGQLLTPGSRSLLLDAGGDPSSAFPPYDIADCFLFRPTSKEQCKKGGWRKFRLLAFKNEGDCVSFVATREKNPPAGP